MSISKASSQELTCEHCDRTFRHEVWIVVDVEERPDLFALCRDKCKIRAFFCPHCHEFSFLYFPLMLFYPTVGRVVFVVDRDWPEDETREMATELAIWISTGVKPDASKTKLKGWCLSILIAQ